MENNIFLLSDASYSDENKIAGLGVIDTFTQKKYKTTVKNINSPYEAEFHALALSIKIAVINNYSNVIFVYDCKELVLDDLKKYVINKFNTAQFLWLKRTYLGEADKLAKGARKLAEKLNIPKATKKEIKEIKEELKMKKCIKFFKSYDTKRKILAILLIANDREKEVLNGFISSSSIKIYSSSNKLLGLGSKKRTLMKFVYQILENEDKIDFLHHITYVDSNTNREAFKKNLTYSTLKGYFDGIFGKLKKNK